MIVDKHARFSCLFEKTKYQLAQAILKLIFGNQGNNIPEPCSKEVSTIFLKATFKIKFTKIDDFD